MLYAGDIKEAVLTTMFHCQLALVAQLVECSLWGTGGHGFDPGARHTKVIKNGTSFSSDLWGRARTSQPSVRIM